MRFRTTGNGTRPPALLAPLVAGAGNDASNNDAVPFYPASYRLPNLISVVADNRGQLTFSNYRLHTVDPAASGQDILSTTPSLIDSGAALRVDADIYRVVVLGFDLEQVADPGARCFLLERILDFYGLGHRDRILLVDDDGDRTPRTARAPDVAPSYEAALLCPHISLTCS